MTVKHGIWIGLIASGIVLSGCQSTGIDSTALPPPISSSASESSTTSSTQAPVVKEKIYPTIIDVPFLLGKDFDQVAAKLGKVLEDDSFSSHGQKWFGKQNIEVGIAYDYGTNKVIEVFLSMNDDNMPILDIDKLMDNGNLTEDDSRYSVDVRKSMNTEGYTGIRVVPR